MASDRDIVPKVFEGRYHTVKDENSFEAQRTVTIRLKVHVDRELLKKAITVEAIEEPNE